MSTTVARGRRLAVHAATVRSAVLHSGALAVACLASYLLITDALSAVHSVSKADDYLGAGIAVGLAFAWIAGRHNAE